MEFYILKNMSKVDFEEYFANFNIDDIFERKIEVGTLIHFNLLQKIIEEFIKRQKIMNDKINNLENKIESISISQGVNDIKNINIINKELSEELIKDKKNQIFKENSFDENESLNNNISEKETINQNINEENNNKVNNEGLVEEKIKYNINNNDFIKDEKIKEIKIKDLSYRIDKIESINKEIVKRIVSFNNENKNDILKVSDNLEDKIKKNNSQLVNLANNIKNLESKMAENNILSNILKLNENNNNEQLTILIQGLDEKINKKMNSLEVHNKDNEEQIIKYKKEITDIKNANQSNIQIYNNLRENYYTIQNNLNELKIKNEKEINDINKIIDEKINEVRNELMKKSNEQNKKISDLIIERNALDRQNQNKNIDTKILTSLNNEKIENLSTELKHYFSKGILDTENYLKSMINNLGIEKIKADLIKIYQELQNKLIHKDLSSIEYKLDEINTKIYENKNQNEEFKNKLEYLNNEYSKNKKMIEYLAGQIIKSYQPDLDSNKYKNKNYPEELKSFVKKDIFEEEINKILKKIEKLLEFENENNKYINLIDKKSENHVTDKDLKNLENYIINIIEEYKIISNKKFLEKKEGQKSFKFLELQIKSLNENININSPFSYGDNWLLAKKPMNNYLCASCESYIGDLKNKNDFLPWNKISPREGKKYRMGQGFSHMLQMVNMDLMKNAEKINDDFSIKFEENNNIKNFFEKKLTPRINSSKDIRKMRIKNNSINRDRKIREINDCELNTNDINNAINSTNSYNYSSLGMKINNSIDIFNDKKKKKLNIKKIDKIQSPIEIDKNIQTFSKINIKTK